MTRDSRPKTVRVASIRTRLMDPNNNVRRRVVIAPKAVATPAPENKSTTPEISPEFACPSLVDAHGL